MGAKYKSYLNTINFRVYFNMSALNNKIIKSYCYK